MTFQEKKAYLDQYRACVRRVDSLLIEYEKWEAIATSINQKLSAVPVGSSNGSKTEIGGQMAEVLQKLETEIKTAEMLRDKIREDIKKKSSKGRYRELLEFRYIHGMSLRQIADTIDKDERTVRYVMNSAINGLRI